MYVVSESMFLLSDRVLSQYWRKYMIQTLSYWSSSELAELERCAVLNKTRKDDADQSLKRSLLPRVQQ